MSLVVLITPQALSVPPGAEGPSWLWLCVEAHKPVDEVPRKSKAKVRLTHAQWRSELRSTTPVTRSALLNYDKQLGAHRDHVADPFQNLWQVDRGYRFPPRFTPATSLSP